MTPLPFRSFDAALMIVAACFTGATIAQEPGCPCVTSSGLPRNGDGRIVFTDLNGNQYFYPGDYGEGECRKWDELLPPYCAASGVSEEFEPIPTAPAWCELSWCYVDPTNCDQGDVTKTFSFDAEIRLAEKTLYYSYATCGSSDDPFAKWSRSAGLEAEDLVKVVEDYLVTEIKPLSEQTLSDLQTLSSAACNDGWIDSCACTSCGRAQGEWGDNEIDLGKTSVTVSSQVDLTGQDLKCLSKIVGRKYRNIVKSEYDDPRRVGYLYFGKQDNGGYFQWPAVEWCPSAFDPRFRPWYASAVSGPKEVVLVIDKSGSMSDDSRMAQASEAAQTVLDTLTEYDRAGVVFFDNLVFTSQGGLLPMTTSGISALKSFISESGRPGGGTNFKDGFQAAFDMLRADSGGCQKIILFLTDGEDGSDLELSEFDKEGWNGAGDVTVFSYVIGGDSDSLVSKPARIACQNGGKYFVITDLAQIKDTMADYFRFFADSSGDAVRWIEYNDAITGERLISGCLAIYQDQEVFGTACMDINVIIDLETLESKSTFAQFEQERNRLSTACRPVTHTAEDLVRLRGDSDCAEYGGGGALRIGAPAQALLAALLALAASVCVRSSRP